MGLFFKKQYFKTSMMDDLSDAQSTAGSIGKESRPGKTSAGAILVGAFVIAVGAYALVAKDEVGNAAMLFAIGATSIAMGAWLSKKSGEAADFSGTIGGTARDFADSVREDKAKRDSLLKKEGEA